MFAFRLLVRAELTTKMHSNIGVLWANLILPAEAVTGIRRTRKIKML
jgi:hypothetical protein